MLYPKTKWWHPRLRASGKRGCICLSLFRSPFILETTHAETAALALYCAPTAPCLHSEQIWSWTARKFYVDSFPSAAVQILSLEQKCKHEPRDKNPLCLGTQRWRTKRAQCMKVLSKRHKQYATDFCFSSVFCRTNHLLKQNTKWRVQKMEFPGFC